MPHSCTIVIGASAGGFEAVASVLAGLPQDLPAAVLVVIHAGPGGILPAAFRRGSALPVDVATDGQALEDGRVYLPPPDRHLTVQDGVVRTAKGPREHGFRPAVDPLFITAARAGGVRVAGVILSGALSDGTLGLSAVEQAGGWTIVQHPDDATFPSMPLSALRSVVADLVLPAAEIGRELTEWAMRGRGRHRGPRQPATGNGQPGERGEDPRQRAGDARRELMAFTCPSCGGAISESQEGGIALYECHVGHRFDGESMLALGDERTEDTLWQAARALQERALLRRRMHTRAQERGLRSLAEAWLAEATDSERRAEQVRQVIENMPSATATELLGAGTARAADGLRPRRNGQRPSETDSATRQQARASSALHQASRPKAQRRSATNGSRTSRKRRR